MGFAPRYGQIFFLVALAGAKTLGSDNLALPAPQTKAAFLRVCVTENLIEVQKSWSTYRSEISTMGIRRLVVKPRPPGPDLSDSKLWGTLIPFRPDPSYRWYTHIGAELTQFIPKRLSKALTKDSVPHEFKPFSTIYNSLEKRLLPALTLTIPVHLAIGVATAKFSFPILFHDYVMKKKSEKEKRDAIANIDALIDDDFRFRAIKWKMERSNLPAGAAREAARAEAEDLIGTYQFYQYQMQTLHEQNVDPESPEATSLMLSDPVVSPRVSRLFKDIYVLDTPEFWSQPDYKYPENKTVSPDQLQQIMQIIHARIAITTKIPDWVGKDGFHWPFTKSKPADADEAKYHDWLFGDPFSKELDGYRAKGVISRTDEMYYLMKDLEWRTRFQEWSILGIHWMNGPAATCTEEVTLDDIRAGSRQEVLSKHASGGANTEVKTEMLPANCLTKP